MPQVKYQYVVESQKKPFKEKGESVASPRSLLELQSSARDYSIGVPEGVGVGVGVADVQVKSDKTIFPGAELNAVPSVQLPLVVTLL